MGRLDDWLDLVGLGIWIHYCPIEGDRVALATVCYSSMSSHFSFPLTCYSLSGLALVSTARGLFKVVIPVMHGIHPPDQSSSIVQSHNMSLYTHKQYCADLLLGPCCTYCHLLDIVFISCSYIRHVIILFSLSFLCTLARSHLRP